MMNDPCETNLISDYLRININTKNIIVIGKNELKDTDKLEQEGDIFKTLKNGNINYQKENDAIFYPHDDVHTNIENNCNDNIVVSSEKKLIGNENDNINFFQKNNNNIENNPTIKEN